MLKHFGKIFLSDNTFISFSPGLRDDASINMELLDRNYSYCTLLRLIHHSNTMYTSYAQSQQEGGWNSCQVSH